MIPHSGVVVVPTLQPLEAAVASKRRSRPRLILGLPILALVIALVGIYAKNYVSLQTPMNEVLSADSRNEGIAVRAHYRRYVQPSTLVIDLREVSGPKSRVDVFRVLLQFADKMKSKSFDKVFLASSGTDRFILDGSYFKLLGMEYPEQNPIYTMRTFPSHLMKLDGTAAYGQWEGGLFAVVEKELTDFGDFVDGWVAVE